MSENLKIHKSRIPWIDGVKGACIFFVLFFHINMIQVGNLEFANKILSYLFYFSACFMPCFFVISGFTFKDKEGIVKQRAKQLLVPYFCWGLTYYVIFLAKAFLENRLYPLQSIKYFLGLFYSRPHLLADNWSSKYYIMPPGSGPLWFLSALFVSYLLFLILYKAKTPKIRIMLLLSYLVIMQLLHYCPILLPWSIDTAFAGALLIYGGYKMRELDILNLRAPFSYVIGLSALALYIWSVNANGGSGSLYIRGYGKLTWAAPIVFLFMGLTGTYLWSLICMFLQKIKLISPLSCLGKISLELLCSHTLIYIIIAAIYKTITLYFSVPSFIDSSVFVLQIIAAVLFVVSWKKLTKKIQSN